ncbi:hypothetical protein B7486_13325 [cyanobacterium TDX16]|nr:hypothetical protein B7486_13325 [cyanobacterium TDX16]
MIAANWIDFDVSTFRRFDVYASPSILQHLRASNEAACRLATAHQQLRHRLVSAALHQPFSLSLPKAAGHGPPKFRRFDFSIFRRFHHPPQLALATSVGTISKRRVSPYVTLQFPPPKASRPAQEARRSGIP